MVGDTELSGVKNIKSAIFRAQKGPCGDMVGDTELLGGKILKVLFLGPKKPPAGTWLAIQSLYLFLRNILLFLNDNRFRM